MMQAARNNLGGKTERLGGGYPEGRHGRRHCIKGNERE